MKRLLILSTTIILALAQISFARDGADDPAGDDHGGRSPVSTRLPERTPGSSDDHTPIAGRPDDNSHNGGENEGWRKLRLISANNVSGLRARVRDEDKRRASRFSAEIKLLIPNSSLGFLTIDQALAASYFMRIENASESPVICALSADDVREQSPLQLEFALDVRSKSGVVTNKKGSCVAAADATLASVLPSLSRGSVVTASVVVAGQSRDVATLTIR